MSDYKWRDKTDPAKFTGKWEEGLKHYRREWDRLTTLIADSWKDPKFDKNEREEMQHERNQAAARVIGFSHGAIPD